MNDANALHSARQYFLQAVVPAYEAYGRTLDDGIVGLRRDTLSLGNVATACLHLADHLTKDKDVRGIVGAPKSKLYVKHLAKQHPCFRIVRDVANAQKHRSVSADDRTIEGLHSLDERWILVRHSDEQGIYFDVRKDVIISMLDGQKLLGSAVVAACLSLWVHELVRLNVIPRAPRMSRPRGWYVPRSLAPKQIEIELWAEAEEPFRSQPLILSYKAGSDLPVEDHAPIGTIDVYMTFKTFPSRFATDGEITVNNATVRVQDTPRI